MTAVWYAGAVRCMAGGGQKRVVWAVFNDLVIRALEFCWLAGPRRRWRCGGGGGDGPLVYLRYMSLHVPPFVSVCLSILRLQ